MQSDLHIYALEWTENRPRLRRNDQKQIWLYWNDQNSRPDLGFASQRRKWVEQKQPACERVGELGVRRVCDLSGRGGQQCAALWCRRQWEREKWEGASDDGRERSEKLPVTTRGRAKSVCKGVLLRGGRGGVEAEWKVRYLGLFLLLHQYCDWNFFF